MFSVCWVLVPGMGFRGNWKYFLREDLSRVRSVGWGYFCSGASFKCDEYW